MKNKTLLVSGLLVLFALGSLQAGDYKIDSSHTGVGFKVKHLAIANVNGNFKEFSGKFGFDEKTNALTGLDVTIKASSINTNDSDRDAHLKKGDFFDVDKYPELTFKVANADIKKGGVSKVKGDLTIKGVTKPVVLNVKFLGSAKDPWGNQKLAFEAETKIKRTDFGLTWNKTLETGGVLVGEEVTIQIEGQAVPAAPAK
ncbi:YceI family protein [Leptospira wolffii]|uniref:Polyisoprenoid-binding protein n=1 Tax=Leptospira wolffii TaxID=409998 RepID=A0A2M9ZFT3_9LEPT|nr:YceI family protein [Leptospira wolffii]EPG65570.1 YceI-like domain protein [Leptospira wolffii serovar Khorat str. Khorat-H2]PJZ67288.1 polyisoprenoid-binding protein [Leptospira wolffii]TGK62280.1 polyisoprenoid-binding protein [Leptospira wolffii]TGK68203.1 polyisoprenoid-binding protein [Leptospira wolffii]TGK74336.1 polyisoprenoid-binding protein [Leptospira wolffii]